MAVTVPVETHFPDSKAFTESVSHSLLDSDKLLIVHTPEAPVVVVAISCPVVEEKRFMVTPDTLSGDATVPEIEVVVVRIGLVVIEGSAVAVAVEY